MIVRTARGISAAILFVMASAGCSMLRPAPVVDDLSTWSLVPLPPDPRFVQAAGVRCGDADAAVGPLSVILQDRRTANTSALLTAAGPLHGSCFLTLASGGGGSGSTNQPLAAMTGPIAIDEQSSGGVADGEATLLGGRAGPDVRSVQLTLADGRVMTASIGSGHWLAWWPGSGNATKLVAFDDSGVVLVSIDQPVADGPTK